MKGIAVIAARMTSTRFPGKMIAQMGEECLLSIVIKRALMIRGIDQVVLATSDQESDGELVSIARKLNISVFKGELSNVALRFRSCVEYHQADFFIRLNGDSPFLDFELISECISFIHEGYDIVTNIGKRTFPYGVALEIINSQAFLKAYPYMDEQEREHVTSYFYNHASDFKMKHISNPCPREAFAFPLTIDHPEDLKRLTILLKPNIFRHWKDIPDL